MSGKTGIPYADKSWNPIVGCPLPLVSPGCKFCWARDLHNMRHKAFLAGKKLSAMYAKPFEEIQFFPERLEQPLHWKKPQTIFVGSQTDLFHPDVKTEWQDRIFEIALKCPQHKFLFLTKRPKEVVAYYDYFQEICENCAEPNLLWNMPNAYLGLTICNQPEADKLIPIFLQIPAAHRGLSIEPMLGEINLGNIRQNKENPKCNNLGWQGKDGGYPYLNCLTGRQYSVLVGEDTNNKIDWVVVGCESGPHARLCPLANIERIVDQCDAAGVRVYVKQVQLYRRAKKTDINVEGKDDNRFVTVLSTNPAEWPEKLKRRDSL